MKLLTDAKSYRSEAAATLTATSFRIFFALTGRHCGRDFCTAKVSSLVGIVVVASVDTVVPSGEEGLPSYMTW